MATKSGLADSRGPARAVAWGAIASVVLSWLCQLEVWPASTSVGLRISGTEALRRCTCGVKLHSPLYA